MLLRKVLKYLLKKNKFKIKVAFAIIPKTLYFININVITKIKPINSADNPDLIES